MRAQPDYTFTFEQPPPPRKKGPTLGEPGPPPTTALRDNLVALSEAPPGSGGATPPSRTARIVVYGADNTARSTATALRQGRKLPNRPAGTWEFTTGPTDDGRFGIWATYTPPSE